MRSIVFILKPHNILYTVSQSCSLHYISGIANVDSLQQLLGPATISVNGCCNFNVILWNKF